MRRTMVAAGLALTLIVSACGDDDDGSAPGTSSSSRRSSTSTSTTSTTAPCSFTGATLPQNNALASENQLLSDVSAGRDGCVDTITFTFRPSGAVAPSYQISYEPGPFLNTAGEEVRPDGSAFLKIRFEPAWIADLSVEAAPLTYTGPREINPTGLNYVRGLDLFDASEAVVGWVAGIDGERPFRVEPSPGKVVITIGP